MRRIVLRVVRTKGKRDRSFAGWSVDGSVSPGPKRALGPANGELIFKTKNEAIDRATNVCWDLWRSLGIPSQLMVHKGNGDFHFEYTYGHDPKESEG